MFVGRRTIIFINATQINVNNSNSNMPSKTKVLACLMIESQFAYCPLIWMFCLK